MERLPTVAFRLTELMKTVKGYEDLFACRVAAIIREFDRR
jgi:hypothetical protein